MSDQIWAHVATNPVTHVTACDNIIVLNPATAGAYPMDGLYRVDQLSPQPGIGWTFDGTTWTSPPPPAPPHS